MKRKRPNEVPLDLPAAATGSQIKTNRRQDSTTYKRFECATCKKRFQFAKALKHHMQDVHASERQFVLLDFGDFRPEGQKPPRKRKRIKCTACKKVFHDNNGLSSHMQAVHIDKQHLVCNLPMKTGDCPPAAGQEPNRKRVECDVCKKSFKRRKPLKVHMRAVHSGNPRFFCKHCNKGFLQDTSLNCHMASKHPDGLFTDGIIIIKEEEPVKLDHTDDDKPHLCQVCGKGFATGEKLVKHVGSCTGAGGGPSYRCGIPFSPLADCPAANLELPIISNHLETRADDFLCDICGRMFAKQLQLTAHQRSHFGKKLHRCQVCKKYFALLTELQLHTCKRQDAGEKSFVCPLCPGASFNQLLRLNRHLLRVHKTKKWHDSICKSDAKRGAADLERSSLDASMQKYWCRRYAYFSRFDSGIKLDLESWYSVTPENLARHHAERMRCDVIIDGFCGVGGNAIQFAMTCKKVIAIDIDPDKIEMAKNNAAIYGIAHKIDFLVGDFLELAPILSADLVFLSPPWGGSDYNKEVVFDLETMLLPVPIHELMAVARQITPDVAVFLPKNSNTHVLSGETAGNRPVEIEQNFADNSLMAITVYFGGLAKESSPHHHQAM